jgi:hypothetical protein
MVSIEAAVIVIRVYDDAGNVIERHEHARFQRAVTPFVSIATLFLSVAVAVIAWQQWRVADNKLRLDLFERRYKVYDALRLPLSLM